MKGRIPTTTERKFHDMLCSVVGCAACRFGHNMVTHYVSVHHQRGRVRPLAHYFVLPLCAGHHQAGTGASWMIAVHPDKARFEQRYGEQEHLLRLCVLFLLASGQEVPELALTAAEVDREVADRVAALAEAGGRKSMNVHGYIVPDAAIDAGLEFMRAGSTFDCKKLGRVIGRHFPFQKAAMSPEGHRTVCLDAAHRLMREMRTELELVRRSSFRTEHHHYRWRTAA